MAKSLLSNFISRFGINIDKTKTSLVNTNDFNELQIRSRIIAHHVISDDLLLVTYIKGVSKELSQELKFDHKILSKYISDSDLKTVNVTSVAITAAVNSYARIYMSKLKLDILNSGVKIYYSDTDSIVTDKELSDSLVSSTVLGCLKLEHILKEGIFISGKTYALINDQDKVIIKSKGVNSNSLSYDDFIKLLNNINISTAIKTPYRV